MQVIETPVLIVGAGPIGLTLALDLAWRGVDRPALATLCDELGLDIAILRL